MSILDFENDRINLDPSPLESERFGYTIERLLVGQRWMATQRDIGAARADLASVVSQSSADVVIARFPSEHLALVSGLAAVDRTVLPSGSLLYWGIPVTQTQPSKLTNPGTKLRLADKARDQDTIKSVVNATFTDYVNHYHANPLFRPDLVSAGYAEWAHSTAFHPEGLVYLLSTNDNPLGIATVRPQLNGTQWEVELAGIVRDHQGKGLYSNLFSGIVTSAFEHGISRIVISTQTHNLRVQRAWVGLGLKPLASIDSAHLVRTSALAQLPKPI